MFLKMHLSYFINLYFSIKGKGFTLPFTTFIIPIIKNTKETIKTINPSIQPKIGIIVIKLDTIDKISNNSPWLEWYFINPELGLVKNGISIKIPK